MRDDFFVGEVFGQDIGFSAPPTRETVSRPRGSLLWLSGALLLATTAVTPAKATPWANAGLSEAVVRPQAVVRAQSNYGPDVSFPELEDRMQVFAASQSLDFTTILDSASRWFKAERIRPLKGPVTAAELDALVADDEKELG